MCMKRTRRSRYFLPVDVTLTDRKDYAIPARIFCVRNRKDWIAFISTNTSFAPVEILHAYIPAILLPGFCSIQAQHIQYITNASKGQSPIQQMNGFLCRPLMDKPSACTSLGKRVAVSTMPGGTAHIYDSFSAF